MSNVDNGWETSAEAWIASQGTAGDFGRQYVLDPVMLTRVERSEARTALDIGCGEGRFCRLLDQRGIAAVGVDPTAALVAAARQRHPAGCYVRARAEALPCADASVDLAVSYLSLIDIDDACQAIAEMARVLRPGGTLLVANLTSFNTAGMDIGWITDWRGRRRHYPVDRYLDRRAVRVAWGGIRIRNHHRPMRDYMQALLAACLTLTHFDEPEPTAGAPADRAREYRRAPYFLVMEWRKSTSAELLPEPGASISSEPSFAATPRRHRSTE